MVASQAPSKMISTPEIGNRYKGTLKVSLYCQLKILNFSISYYVIFISYHHFEKRCQFYWKFQEFDNPGL